MGTTGARMSTTEATRLTRAGRPGLMEHAPAPTPNGLARASEPLVGLATSDDPHLGLIGVTHLRHIADALETYQVQRARAAGMTWAQIGRLLNVSTQAAHRKHADQVR